VLRLCGPFFNSCTSQSLASRQCRWIVSGEAFTTSDVPSLHSHANDNLPGTGIRA
jgi:hypothetical protein